MVDDYTAFMRRRGLAESTIRRRVDALRCFAVCVGDLAAATPDDIDRFLDGRVWAGKPLAARTRYGWVSHLGCFYQWAVDHDLLERNPTLRVERPRLRRLLPRPISEGDLRMALDVAAADRTMSAWLTLAAYGGLRCAEIAGLTADRVLLDQSLLLVLGKGQKERVVPAHPRCVEAVSSYGIPKAGFVFRRPRGGRWTDAAVSREGALFFEGLGMGWRMHSLRHRFGTKALEACGNLRTVQELMGHESPNTTAGYAAYSHRAGRAAVLGLDCDGEPVEVPLPFE